MAPRYRPSVAAILRNSSGQVLIGERRDTAGCWQFPQGGLDPGETPVAGLARELREELGIKPDQYAVIDCKGLYRYLFPPGRTKAGYQGQEQTYFLLDWLDGARQIEASTPVPEFRAVRWILPQDFQLAWLPPMKHAVYRQVFQDFFAVGLGGKDEG
jgi:putative (di)nucleoside polyphosphate hydrolase